MAEGTPTVSVIIPTHNRAHLVGRAMRSIMTQTYQDFEIIVVDDGSSDGTEEAVRSFSDPRICYIRHEENRGGSAARNTGIRAAQGEYVAFLDSDDRWLREKLMKQVERMASTVSPVGFVYTGERVVDSETGRCLKRKLPSVEGNVHKRLLAGDFIGTCSSVMVRKNAIEGVGGFDEELVSRQDWDCWLRVSRRHLVGCVPDTLVIRYIGHSQISTRLTRILDGSRALLEKHRLDFEGSRRAYAAQLLAIAQMELAYSWRDGWSTGMQSLRQYPFQPKLAAALALPLVGRRTYWRLLSRWKRLRGDLYLGRSTL